MLKVIKEALVSRERKEMRETLEHKAIKAGKDLAFKDHKVHRGKMEHRVRRVRKGSRAMRVVREFLVHRVRKVGRVLLVREMLVLKVFVAIKDIRVMRESKDRRAI